MALIGTELMDSSYIGKIVVFVAIGEIDGNASTPTEPQRLYQRFRWKEPVRTWPNISIGLNLLLPGIQIQPSDDAFNP